MKFVLVLSLILGVPSSHMEGISDITIYMNQEHHPYIENAVGVYYPSKQSIELYSNATMKTFIHEVGHHRCYQLFPEVWESVEVSEKCADIYAEKYRYGCNRLELYNSDMQAFRFCRDL